MAIDVYLRLDDVGLFKKPRPHEQLSQYQRAVQVRDQFATCMRNALRHHYCVMPELCAHGDAVLDCAHLTVDYSNFTGNGIPLTGRARTIIDARLRAIGTLVFRRQTGFRGALPGDIHVPALSRISSFPGQRQRSGAAGAKPARASKDGGLVGRFFGSIFG
jgi:hypothetical protein